MPSATHPLWWHMQKVNLWLCVVLIKKKKKILCKKRGKEKKKEVGFPLQEFVFEIHPFVNLTFKWI